MTIIITAVSSSFRHQKGPWQMPQASKGLTPPTTVHSQHLWTLFNIVTSLC